MITITSKIKIPWPHWVLRLIASGNEDAYSDAIWSVGGSPPWGNVSYEEASAIYDLLENCIRPGMVKDKFYNSARMLLKNSPDRQIVLELLLSNNKIISNPDNYGAEVVEQGLALSRQVKHDGILGAFLCYQSGLAYRSNDIPLAIQTNWQALQIYLQLADKDSVYSMRAAQCSQNAVSYLALSGDRKKALQLQEKLAPVLKDLIAVSNENPDNSFQRQETLNKTRQPPLFHYQAHHACVLAWTRSGYREHSALDGVASALEVWLNEYPAQADQIQQLAISDCYTAAAWHLYHVVEKTARVGLDAALIRPEVTHMDTLGLAVLALILSEALLAQDQNEECQRMLDFSREKIASLEQTGPVHAYLNLHSNVIAGFFAEAMLEYEIAAKHYCKAMEMGLPLLESPTQLQELGNAWTPLLYGSGPNLIPDGAAKSATLLKSDIRSACSRAILGYARTTEEEKVKAARKAIDFLCLFGLPPDGNPIDLRQVLINLPFAELQHYLPNLLVLADEFQRQWNSTSWKVLFHTTTAVHPENPVENARLSLDEAARAMHQCNDALTMVLAIGDLMTFKLQKPRPVEGSPAYRDVLEIIHIFTTLFRTVSKQLVGSKMYLPFKALLDAPISCAIEWLFDCPQEQLSEESALLSVLLDALRTRNQEIPPKYFEITSTEHGLSIALNRLRRLGFAMTQVAETTAIVLQTVKDDTLFFCASGDSKESLFFARTGPAYRTATHQLINALRSSLNLPAEIKEVRGSRPSKALSSDLNLVEAGKAAFNALPERVAKLIENHQEIIWAPDFRSDQDDVPFELFHNGTTFLGLTKVIARALSLQELLLTVEPPVLQPAHETHRSLVIATPRVTGFPELTYSEYEAHDIRDKLIAAGIESPALEESELDVATLLYAFEKADVVHIAAHGVTWAGGEALVMPHGELMLADVIERKPQFLRSFVFLNTCSLGQSRYLGGGVSRGIAYALIRQHAPAVVANLLPVYDRSSGQLSVEFYNQAQTVAIGEALRRARAKLDAEGLSPAHWGCTVLIGDPKHILPSAKISTSAIKHKQDTAIQLLDVYMNPKKTEQERIATFRAAISDSVIHGNNPRLLASIKWIQDTSTIDPNQEIDPDKLEHLAVLAHEIGHSAGEALMRFYLATKPPKKRSQKERLSDLDIAIRLLEPLSIYNKLWSTMLRECLSTRQRLMVPNEPTVMNLDGISVNDQTIPEVRAFYDIQHSLDQEQIRHGQEVQLRFLEKTLEDIAWNAIVIGQKNRFASNEAHIEFASLLAEKLCAKKLLLPIAKDHARRIIVGFLPFLWSEQRVIFLDRELAIGQAETLILVLRSIISNWTPPETSPAYPLIANLAGRIDQVVQIRTNAGLSKYARALLAISSDATVKDELSGLGFSLRNIIEGMPKVQPTAKADCAAWIVGLLLEKGQNFLYDNNSLREVAFELYGIFDSFYGDLEGWFMPYLMEGFACLRSKHLSIMNLWQ